ncbi:Signal transduction histidine-protein kinase/phosphatase DegS [Kordia antarctica]|uniref:histidine kinase n=1 Tax=Kordia antarctica TaxID=1218801 RepID=A0A7L4ZPP5_9FLAO|nr:ATP-binding protein [Kordia antarctica]QHI38602.1 Signal transduction histidine-protein kinase/phosphatase DegS [Kordia antarctica]
METWQKPETIILWIIIVGLFLVVLLTTIIFLVRAIFKKIIKAKENEARTQLAYQQNLLETTIKTQEIERHRIAADIHDGLIGKLTAIKMQQEINQQDQKTIDALHESINIARRISHDLSPPLIEYTKLPELIKEILYPWEQHLLITAIYDIRQETNDTDDFKVQITRIIQEIITNIIKHANATQAVVHLKQTKNYMALLISDNGNGYDVEKNSKGLGTKNIETRVQYLKGIYKVTSELKKGTTNLFLFKN